MSKDKPVKKISMKELIAEKSVKETPESAIVNEQLESDPLYNDEQNQKLIDYNANIKNINPKYATLVPRFDVLVRVFVQPMEIGENQVLKPNTIPVTAPTNSGVGYIGSMANPFPYTAKAMVVAVPSEIKDLKPGDVVILADSPVKGVAIGRGDQAVVTIPNKFVHPDEVNKYPLDNPVPTDPSDENYGYLIIKPYDIKIII